MFRASLCPSSGERHLLQQPSQWSHPQHSTTVPQTATSSTTRKYTPHAVKSVFLLKMGIKMPETCWDSVNNQHPLLTINHLYCCTMREYLLKRNSATVLYNGRSVLYYTWTRSLYIMSTQIANSYTSFRRNTTANTLSLIQHKSDPQAKALRGRIYKHDT